MIHHLQGNVHDMKNNIRFNLHWMHGKKPAPVYLIYRWAGQRLYYATGVKVVPSEWNLKTGRAINPRGNPYKYMQVNEVLDNLERLALEIIKKNGDSLTLKEFTDLLDSKAATKQKQKRLDLATFARGYTDARKATTAHGTWKVLNTVTKHLEAFTKAEGPTWMDHINTTWKDNFVQWLREQNPDGYQANYLAKVIGVVNQFLNAAHGEGLHSNLKFKQPGFIPKKIRHSKAILTMDQVKAIASLDLPTNGSTGYLAFIRDMFVLQCLTGLRYGDVLRIRMANIKGEAEGEYLEVLTQKTKAAALLPVFPLTKEILTRWEYLPRPKAANQVYNRYLKDICKRAGLSEPIEVTTDDGANVYHRTEPLYSQISSHTGRRTFASILYANGVPASKIIGFTGHATEKQLFAYIYLDKQSNAADVARMGVDWF